MSNRGSGNRDSQAAVNFLQSRAYFYLLDSIHFALLWFRTRRIDKLSLSPPPLAMLMSFHVSRFHVIKQFLRMLSNHALCSPVANAHGRFFFYFFILCVFSIRHSVDPTSIRQMFALAFRLYEIVHSHATYAKRIFNDVRTIDNDQI